jgi:hypothetical protein
MKEINLGYKEKKKRGRSREYSSIKEQRGGK